MYLLVNMYRHLMHIRVHSYVQTPYAYLCPLICTDTLCISVSVYVHRYLLALCISVSVYVHRYLLVDETSVLLVAPDILCTRNIYYAYGTYIHRYLLVDETSVLLVAPDASGSLAQGVVTQVCVCAPVWVCVCALACVWVLNHTHTKTRAMRVFRGFDPYLVHA